MSGEFGEYNGSFFHHHIAQCAEDCAGGKAEITKLWAKVLEEFSPIARAISYSEAGDSGQEYPILETIKRMGELKTRLNAIEEYLRPFKDVAFQAVKDAIKVK